MYIDWPKNSSSPCRCRCQPLKLAGNRFTTSKWLHGHNSCSAETYGTTLLDLIHLTWTNVNKLGLYSGNDSKRWDPATKSLVALVLTFQDAVDCSCTVMKAVDFASQQCLCWQLTAFWDTEYGQAARATRMMFTNWTTWNPLGLHVSCWEFCQSPCIPWMKMLVKMMNVMMVASNLMFMKVSWMLLPKTCDIFLNMALSTRWMGKGIFSASWTWWAIGPLFNVLGIWPDRFTMQPSMLEPHRQQSPKGFATGAWQTVQDVFGKILKAFRHHGNLPWTLSRLSLLNHACCNCHIWEMILQSCSHGIYSTHGTLVVERHSWVQQLLFLLQAAFLQVVSTNDWNYWQNASRFGVTEWDWNLTYENLARRTSAGQLRQATLQGFGQRGTQHVCWTNGSLLSAMRMRRKFVQTDFWPLPTDALFRLKNFWKGCTAMSCGYRPQLPWKSLTMD